MVQQGKYRVSQYYTYDFYQTKTRGTDPIGWQSTSLISVTSPFDARSGTASCTRSGGRRSGGPPPA
ncbi:hypothetical protein SAY86_003304 [Trapa natans]|uniref:Uncharacterized protein n=1 Tax=Trapa natans TaxID=22666 RepID=A0AAN7MDZ0_TRANT|nr:hypothetical protein SAY86_003304 [Trapa natans]